jgi:hypothetical protein
MGSTAESEQKGLQVVNIQKKAKGWIGLTGQAWQNQVSDHKKSDEGTSRIAESEQNELKKWTEKLEDLDR